MTRKLRVLYPDAIHHAMNRWERRDKSPYSRALTDSQSVRPEVLGYIINVAQYPPGTLLDSSDGGGHRSPRQSRAFLGEKGWLPCRNAAGIPFQFYPRTRICV